MDSDRNLGIGLDTEDLFTGKFTTEAALQRIRKRLLDLSLRNALLNYRFPKRRALRIIDTPIDNLFERLYVEGKECQIVPVREPARSEYDLVEGFPRKTDVQKYAESIGLSVSFELSQTTERDKPTDIQSLLYADELERILRELDQLTRTSIEESGANILYLSLGYLSWREAESSDRELLAPLIIVPVVLKRTGVDPRGYFKYSLEYTGEDISDNITLREKLRADFNLELPILGDEDEPAEYFYKIEAFVEAKPNWEVQRCATVCLLSFGKLLMYLDLDKKRWPTVAPIHNNPLVSSLFKAPADYEGEPFAPEYNVDETSEIPLIYDADSSQHSAVIDALKGKNLVIEGPPGTGKSQTITNLIATALTRGKTVLFVSDKLAALEVVKRRLDNAGLGAFCLEFHSHKTQKRKILDNIKFRMDQNFHPPIGLDEKLSEQNSHKRRLTRYVTFMNSIVGNKLGLTVYEVLWGSDRYRLQLDKAALLASAEFSFAPSLDSLAELEESLLQLQRHLIASGSYGSENPWWGYLPDQLLFGDEETIADILRSVRDASDELHHFIVASQCIIGFDLPSDEHECRKLCTKLALNIRVPSGREAIDLLPQLTFEKPSETLRNLSRAIEFIRSTEPRVDSAFIKPDSVTSEDFERIRNANKIAHKLNQQQVKVRVLSDRLARMRQLEKHLAGIIDEFNYAVEASSIELFPTRSSFGLLARILLLAKSCPLDLLDLRTASFLESGALKRLREARVKAGHLRVRKSVLAKMFNLKQLPPQEILAETLRVLSSQTGPLRFLSRSWRKARRMYYSVSLNRSRVDSQNQVEALTELLDFQDSQEAFETNAELKRLLGFSFVGIETNFEDLESLASWYDRVETELRPHLSPLSQTDLVQSTIDQPKHVLSWLAARALAFTDECHWIAQLPDTLTSIFPNHETPSSTFSIEEESSLSEVLDRLCALINDLESVTGSISSTFQSNESASSANELINQLLALRVAWQEIEHLKPDCNWLGDRYLGIDTDLDSIATAQAWAQEVIQAKLPTEIEQRLLTSDAVKRSENLVEIAEAIVDRWADIDALFVELRKFGSLDRERWHRVKAITPETVRDRASEALEAIDLLVTWADLSRATDRTAKLGLTSVCEPVLQGLFLPDQLIPAFRYVVYSSIAKSLFRGYPDLMQFSGLSHQQIRERFQQLDNEILQLNRKKCAVDISKRGVPLGVGSGYVSEYSEKYLLDHEIRKKRRHIPIRQLVKRAGGALQAYKPCFMMSPLSVAQYLEPGERTFDLVVIDEASQVKPEDSIGAIARGNQIVVVGDPKQLPPTSFFDTMMADPDDDEDLSTALEEAESILDISQTRFQPARRLRWHYRSQHHSLINFSNTYFYKDRPLFVFPSPYESHHGLGVHWRYISNGIYENRQNNEEAIAVTNSAIEHMKKYPNESVGVVTLNGPQRDLVQDEFDKRLKSDPKVEKYLNDWHLRGEPFFIKNLENVQGDERDAILISTTFGKNPQGVFYQRFGPITSITGWRRLNVLFTRAKRRVELFSSMQPEDIRIDANSSKGVTALRNYLVFAKSGVLDTTTVSDRGADSDFEISVGSALENNGYQILTQLGVAGFFIDIAVRHPDRGGEFLAAIECDGATYHSTRSARDRDRLRQEILEKLGWRDRIYRVWSADWFKDPRTQTKRLLNFLQKTLEQSRQESPAVSDVNPDEASILETEPVPVPQLLPETESGTMDDSIVQLWDYVTYVYIDDDSNHKSVQIVKGHTDIEKGVVGDKMPLARALLGASVGEKVPLSLPGRPARLLEVISIEK